MKNLISYWLLSVLLGTSLEIFSQAEPGQFLFSSIDKPYHAAGEALGYSLFCVDITTQKLLPGEAFVQVELYHPHGALLIDQICRLTNGRGQGLILMPDTLSSGEYSLVSKIGAQSFHKTIYVSGRKNLLRPLVNHDQLVVRPEGGKLIAGVEQRVGIFASNSSGQGVVAQGKVLDSTGKLVEMFATSPDGYANVWLKSKENEIYKFVISHLSNEPDSIRSINGFCIRIDNQEDTLRVSLQSSPKLNGSPFTFRIRAKDKTILQMQGISRYPAFRIKTPVASLLSGIVEAQVLKDDTVVASRAIFISDKDTPSVTFNGNSSYKRREHVEMNLSVHGVNGNPLKGAFAISIYQLQFSNQDKKEEQVERVIREIPQNVLKGSFASIDNYLLTRYRESTDSKQKPIAPINVISGQVVSKSTQEPISDTTVVLSIVSGHAQNPILRVKKTDKDGRFKISFPTISDNCTAFLKVAGLDETQSLVDFKLDQIFTNPSFKSSIRLSNSPFNLGETESYYKRFEENRLIHNSFEVNPIQFLELSGKTFETYALQGFDEEYVMSEYVVLPSLRDIIIDVLDDVYIRKGKNGYTIFVSQRDPYNRNPIAIFNNQPLMLVDGVPMFNTNMVASILPMDIERIGVIYDELFFDHYKVQGVLSITTKNKSLISSSNFFHHRFTTTALQADLKWQFPDYSVPLSKDNTPDFRSVLYYNPLGYTDDAGSYSLKFWTSDEMGLYRLKIEGVTETGEFLSAHTDFRVEK